MDAITLVASVHDHDRATMQAEVQRALTTGADYDIEYRCVWPDGSVHWVQVRGKPELDASGREDTASDVLRLPKPFRVAEMARAIHDAMAEEMLAS